MLDSDFLTSFASQTLFIGSHDKTFEIAADGIIRIVDAEGKVNLDSIFAVVNEIFESCLTNCCCY